MTQSSKAAATATAKNDLKATLIAAGIKPRSVGGSATRLVADFNTPAEATAALALLPNFRSNGDALSIVTSR